MMLYGHRTPKHAAGYSCKSSVHCVGQAYHTPSLNLILLLLLHLQNVTITINIDHCLASCGLNPDVTPLNPSDPTAGPSSRPITRQQLQVLCVEQTANGDARDCSSMLHSTFDVTLGWSVMSTRFDAQAQSFALVQRGVRVRGDEQASLMNDAGSTSVSEARVSPENSTALLGPSSRSGGAGSTVPRGIPGGDGHPQFLYVRRMEF
jgi:hypothetical protein